MERILGLWAESNTAPKHVGELLVEGNNLEFCIQGSVDFFENSFIGSDGTHQYKVFVDGQLDFCLNRSIRNAASYRPRYALRQNYEFEEGSEVLGITEFSFIIPELNDWLGFSTVEVGYTEDDSFFAMQKMCDPIILHRENPYISIVLELETFTKYIGKFDDRTTFVVKNQPRIQVQYTVPESIDRVFDDINALMQFWGLHIGHVSCVEDIRLSFSAKELKTWVMINRDFSYNLRHTAIIEIPRTSLESIRENVENYFSRWYEFYGNNTFSLIRSMYFSSNRSREIFAEDLIVQYVRILEGYHLRTCKDEENATRLEQAFSKVKKEIKKLFFPGEGKALFSAAFEEAIPGYKFTSKHADNVAQWIASGYLSRKGLAERLKELDAEFFGIISKSASRILVSEKDSDMLHTQGAASISDLYFKRIAATRNYYSHYKDKKDDVLSFTEISFTNNVLKALIIMILFSNMGMDKNTIRQIMIQDSELRFITHCLLAGEKDG